MGDGGYLAHAASLRPSSSASAAFEDWQFNQISGLRSSDDGICGRGIRLRRHRRTAGALTRGISVDNLGEGSIGHGTDGVETGCARGFASPRPSVGSGGDLSYMVVDGRRRWIPVGRSAEDDLATAVGRTGRGTVRSSERRPATGTSGVGGGGVVRDRLELVGDLVPRIP